MEIERLFTLSEPYFHLMEMEPSDFANLYFRLQEYRPQGVIRRVRGTRSRDIASFYDEVAAVLQFPYYFGGNTAAFNDCMTDLEWVKGDAYLLLIDDAHFFLADANEWQFEGTVQLLAEIAQAWLTPNAYFPRERPPTPFHYLFRCDPSTSQELAAKLAPAGVAYEIF